MLAILWLVLTAGTVWGGGSGLNVIVVVNQNSPNSVQLGNDYCEQRGVPPQNVLRMTGWSGGAISWSRTDFENRLLNPLLGMLASRGLTNQAEVVLLSMDIPYRVVDGGSQNSTTSALFYGFKADTAPPEAGLPWSCSLPAASSNSYAFSELPWRQSAPNTASTNSFLAMMLTDNTLAQAEQILRNGVVSDSSFPTQAVYLAKTSDVARNVRYGEFDEAIFSRRVLGDSSMVWVNTDATSFTNLRGLLTGLANLSLPTNALVPGAMGDSLTSYAGDLFEATGQTSLLAFLNAGAAGSYGTVVEPCNYTEKFPHPLDYFYQRRGFCLAEAYYQSLRNPYQGLLVGEPLAAPFARRGAAAWNSLTNGQVLSGLATLDLSFFSAASNLPVGQVDLFIDGTFYQTLTNLPPASGNGLSVVLNGVTVSYTVPMNATVASVTRALAGALNVQTNSTRVQAYAAGDRVELQSLDVATPGSQVTLSAGSVPGALGQVTTWLTAAQPVFLDTVATGYLGVVVGNAPAVGDW
ncbi:MAG TPA: TIGR03790 family protein, partial [Bacillota bacterium]|nr:TIGR03790 family protein [Bacillota bacterium]